jgi:hypothetical protein
MHIERNPGVYVLPEQAYVIVPMIGDGRMPLAIGSNLDSVEATCDAMNAAIGADMFVTECLFHLPFGDEVDRFDTLNYVISRDADNMDWRDGDGVSHA